MDRPCSGLVCRGGFSEGWKKSFAVALDNEDRTGLSNLYDVTLKPYTKENFSEFSSKISQEPTFRLLPSVFPSFTRIRYSTPSNTNNSLASRYPANNGFLGNPTRETLMPGTLIDRYGLPAGRFFSPAGTPLANRSLPPWGDTATITTFRVLKPLELQSGRAAPFYGQPGMESSISLRRGQMS